MHNAIKKRKASIVAFILVTASLLMFTGCVSDSGGTDFLDNKENVHTASGDDDSSTCETEPPTEAGYTARPFITQVISVDPQTLIVAGTCEAGASVTISGATIETVTTESVGGNFISQIALTTQKTAYMTVAAQTEGKKLSTARAFSVEYDATAEKRIDGNGVTVGKSSKLFLDSAVEDYAGKTLFTQSVIDTFKNTVNQRIATVNKSGNVEYIFVLVPSAATVYSDYLPDSLVRETRNTRFKQVSKALAETDATVFDLTELFAEKKDGENALFPQTDSHWTDYAAYLAYEKVMTHIAERFPAAAPRTLSEFDTKKATGLGGDLIDYATLDREQFTEEFSFLVPKFSLEIGNNGGTADDTAPLKLSEIQKYVADNDFLAYQGTGEDGTARGTNQSGGYKNVNAELPCAVIMKDDSVTPIYQILAERFNNAYFLENNAYDYRIDVATKYADTERNELVDYVIVLVSEKNIGTLVTNFR